MGVQNSVLNWPNLASEGFGSARILYKSRMAASTMRLDIVPALSARRRCQ